MHGGRFRRVMPTVGVVCAAVGIGLMIYVANRSVSTGRCGRPSAPVFQFLVGAASLGAAFVTGSERVAGMRVDGRTRRATVLAQVGLVITFFAVVRLMARSDCGS
ncbi:MAG: hypothetical protein NVS3B21_25180 [Acidimicrobiales bacterium]